jgi:hypothetical protein
VSLPAGPYLRFEGTGIVLTVLGQTLSAAALTVDRATTAGPGAPVDMLRLAATGVQLAMGGASPVLTVSDGTALLLVKGGVLAGTVSGTVAVTVPQVELRGR